MRKTRKPSIILAYYDKSDPRNPGWSWRSIWLDENGRQAADHSGGFDGRRDLSRSTVESRARRAAGYPGTRIPVEIR